MGLLRHERPGRLPPDGPAGRAVGRPPARALRVRRVGLRRSAGLAPPHAGHQGPLLGPALPRGLRALRPPARRRGPRPDVRQGRAGPHGPARERVRELRQRPGLHGRAQEDVGGGGRRGAVHHGRRPLARHARGRHGPGRGHRPRPGHERKGLRRGGQTRRERSRLLQRVLSGLADALGGEMGPGRDRRGPARPPLAPRERQVLQFLHVPRRDELRLHGRGQLQRQVRAGRHELRLRRPARRDGPADAEVLRHPGRPGQVPAQGRRPSRPAGGVAGDRDPGDRVPRDGLALRQPAGRGPQPAAPADGGLRTEPRLHPLPDEARRRPERQARDHRPPRLRQRLRGRRLPRVARPGPEGDDARHPEGRPAPPLARHPRRGHGPDQLRSAPPRPEGDHGPCHVE